MRGVRWLLLRFGEPSPRKFQSSQTWADMVLRPGSSPDETQEKLSTDWEATMQDGRSAAVERAPRPSTTGTWTDPRELQEVSRAQDFQEAPLSKRWNFAKLLFKSGELFLTNF